MRTIAGMTSVSRGCAPQHIQLQNQCLSQLDQFPDLFAGRFLQSWCWPQGVDSGGAGATAAGSRSGVSVRQGAASSCSAAGLWWGCCVPVEGAFGLFCLSPCPGFTLFPTCQLQSMHRELRPGNGIAVW